MRTKTTKREGQVIFDAKYIFEGVRVPRTTGYCVQRVASWQDEHARNLEIARILLAHGGHRDLADIVYERQIEYLCKVGSVTKEYLESELEIKRREI